MFITDRLVYLQMQKTGSTHVTKVLRKFCSGKARAKHEQMTDYENFRDRLIVSSVRNPWDWYVSLWAYGSGGEGGLQKYLLHQPWSEIRQAARHRTYGALATSVFRLATQAGRRPDWESLYADGRNEANFRAWLKLVLGKEGRHITKEGYAGSPVKSVIGFMTYRFLALTTEYSAWNAEGRKARSYAQLSDFVDRNTITGRVMRMESLNADLLDVLQSVGEPVTMDDLNALAPTNTSVHRKYNDYYDDECYDLVAERDRLIIERYGYKAF